MTDVSGDMATLSQAKGILRSRLESLKDADFSLDPLRKASFIRVDIQVEDFEFLDWIAVQPFKEKLYWSGRHRTLEVAGIGICDQVGGNCETSYDRLFRYMRTSLGKSLSYQEIAEGDMFEEVPSDLRYYGGIRFPGENSFGSQWSSFGAYRFVVPLFELNKRLDRTTFSCNIKIDENGDVDWAFLFESLDSISFDFSNLGHEVGVLSRRMDTPSRDEWHEILDDVKSTFESRKLQKVVLARKSRFEFEKALEPYGILKKLREADQKCFHYGFQVDDGEVFLGGSPECLYLKSHLVIESEAIAGTRPRGHDDAQDLEFETSLMDSKKDRREHQFVFDMIQERMKDCCASIERMEDLSILKLSKVQHLVHRFKGILMPTVHDAMLLGLLHPTPAVGGFPREMSQGIIASYEPFDRGWYSGVVGWVSYRSSQFVVGIRSGLIQDNCISLFSGAGLLVESDWQQEWDELEHKIALYLDILNVPAAAEVSTNMVS